MDLQLRGKRALITGSTAGIGFAAAAGLVREGASIIVNGRSAERVSAEVEQLRSTAGTGTADVLGVAADLSAADGAAGLVRQVPDVDILVNNLGIFEPKPFEEISDADWLRFFETNVMSGVRLTRHYLPGMKRRDWGRIVFVSSESAVQIPSEMIHYGMTKTAQLAIARRGRDNCRHRGHGQLGPSGSHRVGRRGHVRVGAGETAGHRPCRVRGRILPVCTSNVAVEAVRDGRGSRQHDSLRV